MTKRFPCDYDRDELIKLVYHHWGKHCSIATQLDDTKEKLIQVSKELSALKRKKS